MATPVGHVEKNRRLFSAVVHQHIHFFTFGAHCFQENSLVSCD